MTFRIGLDFDNTIICYDEVFHRLAVEAGLAAPEPRLKQKAVRDAARRSPEGDLAWQRLQGLAYGPRIHDAKPSEGILAFLARCRAARAEVFIISHKTAFAGIDPTRTDLRGAARGWLAAQGFFGPDTGLGPERFLCGATRAEKVALIRDQACTHFIDDLCETFREPGFPPGTQACLYAPGGEAPPADLPTLPVVRTWDEAAVWMFHDA